MTSSYDPQSEHDYGLIGSIRRIGDQVVVYYNHTTLRVEIYIGKFEGSTEIVKIVLSVDEARELEILKQPTIKNKDEGAYHAQP
jgi:hypothetical protein